MKHEESQTPATANTATFVNVDKCSTAQHSTARRNFILLIALMMIKTTFSFAQCDPTFTATISGCTLSITGLPINGEEHYESNIFLDIPTVPDFDYPIQIGGLQCGQYVITHEVNQCYAANGEPVGSTSATQSFEVHTPVYQVTSTVVNAQPTCDQTSTIKYKLCRLPCLNVFEPLAAGTTLTFTLNIPSGLQVVAGGNFTQVSGVWTHTVSAATYNALNGNCYQFEVKLKANECASGPNYTVTLDANNTACVDGNLPLNNTIQPRCPQLSLTKTAISTQVAPNGTVAYHIVVQNTGSGIAQNPVVTDDYDETVLLPINLPIGAVAANGVITRTLTPIAAGATVNFNYTFGVITTGVACRSNVTNSARVVHECGTTPWSSVTLPVVWQGNNTFNVTATTNLLAIPGMTAALGQVQPIYIKIADNVTLNITADVTFPMGSVFEMGANSLIDILPDKILNIPGCHLYACEKLWRGIRLNKKSSLISNGSLIEDAIYAIELATSGHVSLTNNNFQNNIIGFYAAPTASHSLHVASIIQNNTFQSIGNLLPHPINNGIELRGKYGIQVNNMTSLLNIGQGNLFRRLYNGIVTTFSTVRVTRCSFNDIRDPEHGLTDASEPRSYAIRTASDISKNHNLTVTGFDMSTINFQDCQHGIRTDFMGVDITLNRMFQVWRGITVRSSRYQQVVNVRSNQIFACTRGIALVKCILFNPSLITLNDINISNFSSVLIGFGPSDDQLSRNGIVFNDCKGTGSAQGLANFIFNNTIIINGRTYNGIHILSSQNIRAEGNSISMGNATDAANGIRLQGHPESESYLIIDNTITGNTNTLANAAVSGIRTDQSTANLYCNTINNTHLGVSYWGNCVPNVAPNQPNPIAFNNQTFGRHFYGLFVANQGTTNPQNTINSTWGPLSNYGNPQHYQAFSANPEAPNFFPYADINMQPNDFPNTWFNQLNATPFTTCPLFSGATATAEGLNTLDEAIARGSYITDANQDAQLWLGQRKLYSKLQNIPSSVWDTIGVYADFMTNMYGTSAVLLNEVQADISRAYQTQTPLFAQLTTLDSSLRSQHEAWLLAPDSAAAANIEAQIATTNQQTETLLAQLNANLATEAAHIAALNASIAPQNGGEYFEQIVNNAYLETAFLGIDTLTAAQMQTLDPIAQLCPFEYGNCVYQARALMATMDETYADIDDNRACEAAAPLKQPTLRPEAFTIMPNPARDRFTVTLPTIRTPDRLKVFNAQGIEVADMATAGQHRIEINCENWINGLYFVSAITNGHWHSVGKVNIYR